MKNIKYFPCFIFLLMEACFINAQTNNRQFLDSLKAALFPDSKESIEVSAFFGHEKQEMDSIYFVRKIQPDLDIVLPLLKKIAYSKDINLLQGVIDLYEKQQSFFEKEWEPVHRDNIYACEAANKQFSILEAFEETIHSLNFGNMGLNRDAKLAYYKEYVRSQYSYYHVPSTWSKALKGWHIYSPYYMMLRENRWVGPLLGSFSFIEPYVDDIDDLMVDELIIYFDNLDSIKTGNKPSFEQFELDYLCGIISLSKTATFNEKLLYLVLSDKRNKPAYIRGRILHLINNPNYEVHIKSILLEKSINNDNKIVRLNALYGLIFFHDEEVISQYQKLLSNNNIGEFEKQAIESHLLILDRQLNASEEVKQLGNKLLIQIKN